MADLIVRSLWKAILLLILFATALVGVSLAYQAIQAGIGGAWQHTAGLGAVAVALSVLAVWTARHCNELARG